MVNQEKVRLMTQAESYRLRENRRALLVNRYNKGAYVSLQVVKSMIVATLAAFMILLVWALYEAEDLLAINDFQIIVDLGLRFVWIYVAILMITALISWRTYARIFIRSRISVKKYYTILRKINYCNEKDKRRLTGQIPLVRKEGEST